ncbi:MAG: VOC family protein [Mariprofundaceae bacterium]
MFSLHHIALSVSSTERSIQFYQALGFSPVLTWEHEDKSLQITQLKLGDMLLELFCYNTPNKASTSPQTLTKSLEEDLKTIGIKHFGIKVPDIQQAREALIAQKLTDESTSITQGRTGIDYLFIRDPDGLFVEILQDDRDL